MPVLYPCFHHMAEPNEAAAAASGVSTHCPSGSLPCLRCLAEAYHRNPV
ncbi:MAG: hypothetical protein IKK15_00150 [Akkermansia sp.]|nr:hypothetical protein [Akkermansia sp.]